jgi:hypothetical protein
MPVWLQAGGYAMWFVLLFSAVAVAAAARFACDLTPLNSTGSNNFRARSRGR